MPIIALFTCDVHDTRSSLGGFSFEYKCREAQHTSRCVLFVIHKNTYSHTTTLDHCQQRVKMGFTAYLKTILSDLLCGPHFNKNQHAQRHGNKASGRNGSRKGSHQHEKTTLTQKGQHQGTTTPRTTQDNRNHRYLPPNPPNPPPNSPRPRPIRLPQNPPPAPPPSPRPRPIRLGLLSGEPQANNTAQVEANQKSIPIWPASALAASLPPPDVKPRLPRLQDPMLPFPVSAFAPQSQGPPEKGLVQAQQTLTKPLALSSIFEAFDRDGDRDDELHQRPGLPLDAITLAALEEGLQAPVPPVLLSVRMASPAFSCASASSEDTIAMIDTEIVSWMKLSLEQQSVEIGSSLGSGVDSAVVSSGIWTPAGSCSTVASSVSSVPTLSFSAYSCSSNKSGTRSLSRRSIKRVCVPPPWKSGWNESFVRQREYPEWM